MHTVSSTHSFERAAKVAGMTDEEIEELINYLALHPDAGEEIVGSGGCRKFRFARKGAGKRGGYRTVTFYSGAMVPVYLITVFAKGQKSNLSQAEVNQLSKITAALSKQCREKVVKVSSKR
ncbi:type II toxin-antitoxin system RelE/ParE family toxin [Acetobacteraceae bacterium KSS8]|uniref:Type II toxin-antitoxin system RelE/ParE family toxin n=1 Tax=Endosaccharibacter trunci TaxID=2812733 RepID=A0ABT1WC62_9PROT|nr:type II toxin-antitoxin system RelE/ParE family toxin [Acetobacteraceae bacterium KSS8]